MEEHAGSWLNLLAESLPEGLHPYVDVQLLFALLVVTVLGTVAWASSRRLTPVPAGKLQSVGEWAYEGLLGLARGILGHQAERYAWVMGGFFIYILALNLLGLIPGCLSPTAHLNTTFALALCSITIAQILGVRHNGIRYVTRFFFCYKGFPVFPNPLKILEEMIKPISLAIRLFGNVFGDDTAVAQFAALGAGGLAVFGPSAVGAGLGIKIGGLLGALLGVGITSMMISLAMLVAFIQAFVFALLTGSYILFAIELE